MQRNQAATREQAAKWLDDLKDAIPKGADNISTKTVKIWAGMIQAEQIPLEVLLAAMPELIHRYKFFPVYAEFLPVLHEIMGRGKTPTAGEAYEELTIAMRRVGFYQPCPEFSHPAIGKAVGAVGGWRYLCSSSNSVSDRARFFETYERFREQAHREETMPELTKEVAAKYLKQLEAKTAKKSGSVVRLRPRLAGGKEVSSPGRPVEPRPVPSQETGPKLVGDGMSDEKWEERKQWLKEKLHE